MESDRPGHFFLAKIIWHNFSILIYINRVMKKEKPSNDIKPDLKHDTMEFSAATEGEDKLDTDDAGYEEEGITEEELDAIDDADENEAAALIAEENDFAIDETNLPDEDWTDDLPDTDQEEDNNHQRK